MNSKIVISVDFSDEAGQLIAIREYLDKLLLITFGLLLVHENYSIFAVDSIRSTVLGKSGIYFIFWKMTMYKSVFHLCN